MKNIAVEKILKNNSSLRSNIKMFHCNTLLRMKSNTISYMYIYIYITFVIKFCILAVVVTLALTMECISYSSIFSNKRSNKGRWKKERYYLNGII